MKYIRDTTGKFVQRPHFDPQELDLECESIITDYMRQTCGKVQYPIPTDVLTKLIERDSSDLDLYADLTIEGDDIQGVTFFPPNKKPVVKIAAELSEKRSEHRLRTTLTHEYGHVRFHGPLYAVELSTPTLLNNDRNKAFPRCNRPAIFEATEYDWMEWQAGYICGALLMPVSDIRRLAREYMGEAKVNAPLWCSSPAARELITRVSRQFLVSEDAARVRLTKLALLSDKPQTPSLF